jgi:hypothetical protein
MNDVLQEVDHYMLLALAIWFLPIAFLFLITVYLSYRLTPPEYRTGLGNAYRATFVGFAIILLIFSALYFIGYLNYRPRPLNMNMALAIALRIIMATVMLWMSGCVVWVIVELWHRVRDRNPAILDTGSVKRSSRDTVHTP